MLLEHRSGNHTATLNSNHSIFCCIEQVIYETSTCSLNLPSPDSLTQRTMPQYLDTEMFSGIHTIQSLHSAVQKYRPFTL